jgi:hypothetical protein
VCNNNLDIMVGMQDYWKTLYKERKNEGSCFAKIYWGKNKKEEEQYRDTLTKSFKISFAKMQLIRSINCLLLLLVMILFFFITVKRAFYYLSFWALAATFLSQLFLFVSSG